MSKPIPMNTLCDRCKRKGLPTYFTPAKCIKFYRMVVLAETYNAMPDDPYFDRFSETAKDGMRLIYKELHK